MWGKNMDSGLGSQAGGLRTSTCYMSTSLTVITYRMGIATATFWVALKIKGNKQEKYLGFSFSSSPGFYSSPSAFWGLRYKMDMKITYPAVFNEVKQKPL